MIKQFGQFHIPVLRLHWNYKHAPKSVHACTAQNARLQQFYCKALIKLTEPSVRKNLFV